MKKLVFSIKFYFLFIVCLCFSNCKKNKEPIDKSNIVLYDKPLSVIKECIQGKWQLIYGKGGFASNTIQYYHNNFWEFNNNKIRIIDSSNTVADTTIRWVYDRGTFTNGDYTYVMNFYDKRGYIYDYVVDQIYDDTLILHIQASDAVFYHFIKSN